MATARREPITRERLLSTALEIVDREGLDAVSMRRIGDALGIEAMSLYHYVANKAALLDGLVETVLAELGPTRKSDSWESFLAARARRFRAVLLAHPNTLPLFATRPAVTPASIAQVETVLDRLRGASFTSREALATLQVLIAFVVGHTIARHAPSAMLREPSRAAYGELDPTSFPRVLEAAKLLGPDTAESEFEFGLRAMIAGIAAQKRRRAGH
jgi:AcrR family transcriptional regulator